MIKFKDFLKKKFVVVYSGRFQPFHRNHYNTYMYLAKQFGKNNVYIGTSNKVNDKSPLSFNEKKEVITTMFDIPQQNIVKVKNPYNPKEILEKFDDDTIYIAAVGEKDAQRLSSGKYFKKITSKLDTGYKEGGYIYIVPLQKMMFNNELVSGSLIRNIFQNAKDNVKKDLFMKLYETFNTKIYNLFRDKL